MINHLMFADPDMERRFRKLCDSKHEVGGYLFCTLMPVRGLNRTVLKSLFRLRRAECIALITSWVVLPNEHKSPQNSWTTSLNMSAMEKMARSTGSSLGMHYEYHFHTHPSWSITPSQNDIMFWLAHCKLADWKKESISEGVIISSADFDMRLFRVTLDKAKNQYSLKNSVAYSWKDCRVRDYRREVFGR